MLWTRGPDKIRIESLLHTFTGQSLPSHVSGFPIRMCTPSALPASNVSALDMSLQSVGALIMCALNVMGSTNILYH